MSRSPSLSNRFATSAAARGPRPMFEALEDRTLFSSAVAPAAVPWASIDAALTSTTSSVAATATHSIATPALPNVKFPAAIGPGKQLGGNLQWQAEYTNDHALSDLVKANSGFKNLSGGAATTDANGWPTQDFTVSLWGASTVDPGVYNVSFTGPPGVTPSLTGKGTLKKIGYNAATKTFTYTITVPTGSTFLGMRFTNTLGQVKNLHVMQPGTAAGSAWSARYLTHLMSLHPHTLRMMDIVKMNSNMTSDWAQRPKPTDANYARAGVSWEDLIQLCNMVGANMWVCVPVRATDDYVKQLATLIKNNLNPNLTVYVEYSNEVWNTAYDQGKYNVAKTQAELKTGKTDLNYDGNTNLYSLADRLYARRSMQISNIFKSVWTSAGLANPINTRVKVVLGNQAAAPGRADVECKYIAAKYGAPSSFFWGVGVALYWQMAKYSDQLVNGKWTALNTNLTTDQVFEGMGISVGLYETLKRFSTELAHAAPYGLHLDAYELGVDTHGPLNISAKQAASLDPRIDGLMERFLNAFYAQGGDEANWFSLGARPFNTQYGTWTVTDNLLKFNEPKEQGFRALRGYPKIV
jgi:hypothetical protein